jgi:hypothetical protein
VKKYILLVSVLLVVPLFLPSVALGQSADAKQVWVDHIAWCETHVKDVTIVDSNNKLSYGYWQFQMGTWLAYGKQFGATRANVHSFVLQEEVAESMFDQGLGNNWLHCNKQVTAKYGPYPIGQ